jgi:septum formation protein
VKPGINLASRSPRRRSLLAAAGFEVFEVQGRPEPALGSGDPVQAAIASAMAKLPKEPADRRPLLAADTVVGLGNRLFGKPEGRADAHAMLSALSGREHDVVTGVALRYLSDEVVFAVSSKVTFRDLSSAMLEHYLDCGEFVDKAGAYGIQGLGVALVEHVSGSYSNVVGLPLTEVIAHLRRLGVSP